MLTSKHVEQLAVDFVSLSALTPSLITACLVITVELLFVITQFAEHVSKFWTSESIFEKGLTVSAVAGFVFIVSKVLETFEPHLISVFTGDVIPCKLWNWFFQSLLEGQSEKRSKLQSEVDDLCVRIDKLGNQVDAEKSQIMTLRRDEIKASRALFFYFPPVNEDLAGTSCGNIIRAGEAYSYSHYGIDAVLLWPLLWEVLPLDFRKSFNKVLRELLTVFYLTAAGLLLAFQSVLVILMVFVASVINHGAWNYASPRIIPLAVCVCLISITLIVLCLTCVEEHSLAYSGKIRMAFDLHRHRLIKALKLPIAFKSCSVEERKFWTAINQFVFRNYPLKD